MKDQTRSILKKSLFSLLTLSLLALALEFALRLWGLAPTGIVTMRYTTDGQDAFYEPAPNQRVVNNIVRALPHQVTVNAQGLRRTEDIVPHAPGVQRIVCLGDSYTWGTGVDDGETYPAHLEGLLNTSGDRPVQVLNAGVPGTTISDQLPYYRVRFASLRHHAVCLLVCKGDIRELLYKRQRPEPDVMVRTSASWLLALKKRLNRLAMVNGVKLLRLKLFYKPFRGRKARVEVTEADRQAYLERLALMSEMVRERCGCLLLGYIGPLDEDCRRVEAFCRAENLPFMAFEAYKARIGKGLKTDLLPFDGHFNSTGNRILARMFKELLEQCASGVRQSNGRKTGVR